MRTARPMNHSASLSKKAAAAASASQTGTVELGAASAATSWSPTSPAVRFWRPG